LLARLRHACHLERSNLLKSLNHVHRVVERRNTIPILSNVLLSADRREPGTEGDRPRPRNHRGDARQVERAGATTVPAHLLYDIVRKLPDGAEVMLKTDEDGNSMSVISGRSSFRCNACRSRISRNCRPGRSRTSSGSIRRAEALIDKTQFAISTEETRYYLNGIYLHTHEAGGKLKLRAVATDGHRLARAEDRGAGRFGGHARHHHPAQDGQRIAEAGRRPGCRGDGGAFGHQDPLTIGSVVLTSKLIDGTFPDYQRVIPTGNDKR
jgi:DNA polymerase-3 subunit beta